MTWTHVLTVGSYEADAISLARAQSRLDTTDAFDAEEMGQIVAWTDPTLPDITVLMYPSEERCLIFMPWQDRPRFMREFLSTQNCCFKLFVSLHNRKIQRYIVWVQEAMFKHQMHENACLTGEVFILSLLKKFAPESRVKPGLPPYEFPSVNDNIPSDDDEAHVKAILKAEGWPASHPPFKSQIKSARWLHEIEKLSLQGAQIRYHAGIPIGSTGYLFDIRRNELMCEADCNHMRSYVIGACCADAVGTGKTATSLISAVLGSQHVAFSTGVTNGEIAAKGTLIVVPSSIPAHWLEQIKFFFPRRRYITLLCSRDLKINTLRSINDADFVITTFNFLKGKKYCDALHEYIQSTIGISTSRDLLKDQSVLSVCRRGLQRTDHATIPPFVEFIRWPRFMIDEVHEVLNLHREMCIMRSITRNVTFCLTATPDLTSIDSVASLGSLCTRPATQLDDESTLLEYRPCLRHAVEHKLVRRYATQEYKVTHVLHRVTPTPEELLRISSIDDAHPATERVIMICTGHRIEPNIKDSLLEESTHCRAVPDIEMLDQLPGDSDFEYNGVQSHHDGVEHGGVESPHDRVQYGVHDTNVEHTGSKLQRALGLVCQIVCKQSRQVVVASQWTSVCVGFHKMLTTRDIASAVLEGSSVRRASVIRKFQDNEIPVLCISLDRSISGVHLATAGDIVFLHALISHDQRASCMETQMIGRIVRHGQMQNVLVHHMVSRDTSEEELWLSTHSDTQYTVARLHS